MKHKFIILVALGLATTSCSRDAWQRMPGPDDAMAMIPWFANMAKTVSVKPYSETPRPPVEGTVPITGVEAPLPINPANMDRINGQRNPIPTTSESLLRGEDRYGIYCTPCHGDQGAGDGPVNAAMFNIIPSIVTDQARGYSDGYLYSIIRHGRGNMTSYGDRVRGEDRWHLVNYIRQLQGAAR